VDRKARTLTEPTGIDAESSAEIVVLKTDTVPAPAPPPGPPGKLHGAAITGIAISALVGIASILAFVTVGWPGDSGRYVLAVFALSGATFMISAVAAVFAAARDTYPRGGVGAEDRDSDHL
jgi:hypothetical protein